MRVLPRIKSDGGGTITFFLALGAGRQMCRLATTFLTQKQAFSYLHKNRTELERIARARLASGELEDGIVMLSML
ncbi:hypothetical protein [Bradyrhizobium betae]|uniref:DUF1488 domain-containing protein n=1 Tax=Bradyrhizobium betae TaxID=244734 RepID=A0A4Q1VFI2_9BRAD|nr:hypothetical protein [Bradyrhizobium betae]RXT50063.1 hypothetical protein B5V03_09415 [Bradyrhizobium betae]